MKLNKRKFLESEVGVDLKECIKAWDKWLEMGDKESARWCQAQWEVYQLVLKQFYGKEYHFTRTDKHFGVCTNDESDWLFLYRKGRK